MVNIWWVLLDAEQDESCSNIYSLLIKKTKIWEHNLCKLAFEVSVRRLDIDYTSPGYNVEFNQLSL